VPEFIEKYDSIARIYVAYTLYSKEEIRDEWPIFKLLHFANMRRGQNYVTCTVKCEDEALVLIALMMRRTEKKPSNFYYDKESKKILAFCARPDNDQPTVQEMFESVITTFLDDKNLRYMDKDPVGKKLFNDGKFEAGEVRAVCPDKTMVPFTGKLHPHTKMMDDLGTTAILFDL